MINNNNLLLIHPILKEHVLNPQEVRCLQCYLVNYLRGTGQNVFTKTSVTLVLENPFTDNREDLQIPLFWVIIHFFFFLPYLTIFNVDKGSVFMLTEEEWSEYGLVCCHLSYT